MADSPGQTEKAGEQGDGYEITRQNVLHHRYLHLYNRSVRYPDGNVHDFDVVGHPKADFQFTVTFPFHTETQEATVVHEYSQGPNKPMYCFPSGGFDKKKHDSLERHVLGMGLPARSRQQAATSPCDLVAADRPLALRLANVRCRSVQDPVRDSQSWCPFGRLESRRDLWSHCE